MKIGYYKHFKGGVYYLICEAINARENNTQDRFVVYKQIDSDIIFVRPISQFEGFVEVDGEKVQRFKKIENNIPFIPYTPNITTSPYIIPYTYPTTYIHELAPPTDIPYNNVNVTD